MSSSHAPTRASSPAALRLARPALRRIGLLRDAVSGVATALWFAGALLSIPMLAAAASPRAAAVKGELRLAQCSWDQPGHNPFMGDVVAAVDRYTDIPADVRARLKQRLARREYDDIVSIRRDSVEGKARYEPAIRDMHFGIGRVCSNVSRQGWLPAHQERGLVYCEGTECIIVPTVCRNVSRIKREEPAALASRDLLVPDAAPPGDALLFEPPGAGLPQLARVTVPESLAESRADFARFASGGTSQAFGGSGAIASSVPGGGAGFAFETAAAEPGGRTRLAGGGRLLDSGGTPPPATAPLPGLESAAVRAVPEPQTWALMLMGLGACVLCHSRRHSART